MPQVYGNRQIMRVDVRFHLFKRVNVSTIACGFGTPKG